MEHGFAALLGRRGFPLVVISVMLVAAACTGGGPSRSTGGAESSRGGTLRVGMINDENCAFPFCGPEVFDPAMNGFQPPVFEVFRCCLIRTLLSFNGLPTGRGGAVPKPDVAAGLPTVSEDGLTWTFHLRPGLRYAPPLVETRIVARDFIRGIERLFSPRPNFIPDPWGQFLGGYSGGFLDLVDIISGARDYADGKATSISGLEAPNDTTLVVRLTRPTGDLGYRLAQPDFGPIPPNPSEPNAKLGVAEGLARFYGSFVVATGPYRLKARTSSMSQGESTPGLPYSEIVRTLSRLFGTHPGTRKPMGSVKLSRTESCFVESTMSGRLTS